MRATSSVLDALRAVDESFEKRLGKLDELCSFCGASRHAEPGLAAQRDRFDSVIREHRRRRLDLPVHEIWDESFGHGSALVHGSLRRLAWFIPSILSASLHLDSSEALRGLAGLVLEAREGERTYHASSPSDLANAERDSLARFLLTALRSIDAADAAATDDLAALVLLATVCRCDPRPLIEALLDRICDAPMLLAIVDVLRDLDPTWSRRRDGPFDPDRLSSQCSGATPSLAIARRVLRDALFTEETRRRLEARFLEEKDPTTAAAISRAEETVRAMI